MGTGLGTAPLSSCDPETGVSNVCLFLLGKQECREYPGSQVRHIGER